MTYVDAKAGPGFSPERRAALVAELEKRIPNMRCPMCTQQHFAIVEGFFSNTIQPQLGGVVLGGPSIPAAAIICGTCGFISQHALGTLGMLPGKGGEK